MCPHKPEGECGHINNIMTAIVTCVTGPVTINHVSAVNCQIFNFVLIYDITHYNVFNISAGFNGHSSAVYVRKGDATT